MSMPGENTENHLQWADAVRAFAIMAVVMIHTAGRYVLSDVLLYSHNIIWWTSNALVSLSRVGVPLFIILSGALLLGVKKDETISVFYVKRFNKVFIPFLIWTVIYLLWRVYVQKQNISYSYAAEQVINGTQYFHFFFLYIIMALYLITPVLRKFVKSVSGAGVLYCIIICLLPSIIFLYSKKFLHVRIGHEFRQIGYVSYFLIGYYLGTINLTRKAYVLSGALFVVCTAVTAVGVYWDNINLAPGGTYRQLFYEYLSLNVFVMSVSAFILLRGIDYQRLYEKVPGIYKLISVLSTTSFGVYLLHPMVMCYAESKELNAGRPWCVTPGLDSTFLNITYDFLLIIASTALIVLLIRKVPLLKRIVP